MLAHWIPSIVLFMMKNIYFIHKWLSLIFLIPFILLAISGLVIAFKPRPDFDIKKPLPLEEILANLRQERPQTRFARINFDDQHLVVYAIKDSLTLMTIERGNGKVLIEEDPELNPFFFAQTIHESFYLEDLGRNLVAISGIGLCFVLLSGFFFWLRKNLLIKLKKLFKQGRISKVKDLHLMVGIVCLIPLLFSAITGSLIGLNSYFFSKDRVALKHVFPEGCTFEQQMEVLKKVSLSEKGIIFSCRDGSPYMNFIDEKGVRKITPTGKVVLEIGRDKLEDSSFLRHQFFVDLHSGEDFGVIRNPYNLLIGLSLVLLSYTGIAIFLGRRSRP